MSDKELVSFSRGPKTNLDQSFKVPGRLWVTNDSSDNIAEAYIDDTSIRRLKVSDKELTERVDVAEADIDNLQEFEQNRITEEEVRSIVQNMGSNPASPYNFVNNITFANTATVKYSETGSPPILQGIIQFEINPNDTLDNINTDYTILLVGYIEGSTIDPTSGSRKKGYLGGVQLKIKSYGVTKTINWNDSASELNKVNGFTWFYRKQETQQGWDVERQCVPNGTYVVVLHITNNNISIEKLYCFQTQQILQSGEEELTTSGITHSYPTYEDDQSGTIVSYNTFKTAINNISTSYTPRWYTLLNEEFSIDNKNTTIEYTSVPYGKYIRVKTTTNAISLNFRVPLSDLVSTLPENDYTFFSTLPQSIVCNQICNSYTQSGTYTAPALNWSLEIGNSGPNLAFYLKFPGNSGTNEKQLMYFLPNFFFSEHS